jgi:hypothetical protein
MEPLRGQDRLDRLGREQRERLDGGLEGGRHGYRPSVTTGCDRQRMTKVLGRTQRVRASTKRA